MVSIESHLGAGACFKQGVGNFEVAAHKNIFHAIIREAFDDGAEGVIGYIFKDESDYLEINGAK